MEYITDKQWRIIGRFAFGSFIFMIAFIVGYGMGLHDGLLK